MKSKPVVVVELDGFLCPPRNPGDPIDLIDKPYDGAVEFVESLLLGGYRVLIDTPRINVYEHPSSELGFSHLDQNNWRLKLMRCVQFWLRTWGFPSITSDFRVHIDHGRPEAVAYVGHNCVEFCPTDEKSQTMAYKDVSAKIHALRAKDGRFYGGPAFTAPVEGVTEKGDKENGFDE